MLKRVYTVGACCFAILFWFSSLVPAQTPVAFTSSQTQTGEFLRHGQQLEIERRWGDAISYYEEAVRQYPEDRLLEQHFEVARLHYDLGRRYNDRSFCDCREQLSLPQALELYHEILVKIQTHYVEAPNWKDVVSRGLLGLEVALSEPAFTERNLDPDKSGTVEQYCRQVRQMLADRSIASSGDAREAVSDAAQLGHERLGLSATSIVLEFLCGVTNSLDPYSAYLTPNQLSEVYSQIEGNFVGIGVELKPQEAALNVVRVIPNSPAQQNGILAGDQIVAIGARWVRDCAPDQAANLLQGEAGSSVDVTVISPGQASRALRILRQRIEVPSIDDVRMVDAQRGVAYLKLVCFQKNTSRDLDTALWDLHRQGMRSLIVDLRGNPGGLLVAAVEVADKFLTQGVIVSTRGRSAQEDFTYSAHETGTWHVPLTVIIDHDSASAAEIFAGAIRDLHRGPVVGERSYGKGSVQGIFPLNSTGAGVRLTTAKFYSPSGRPYARVGVEPDVMVRQTAKPVSTSGMSVALAGSGADATFDAAFQQAAAQVGQVR